MAFYLQVILHPPPGCGKVNSADFFIFMRWRMKMLEELKKVSFKKCIPFAVFFILIGIVMVVLQAQNVFYTIFGYAEFTELAPDEIKSQLVEVDLTANFGYYLEEYEENTKTHRKTTTSLYYVIWTGDEDDVDYRYMSIKIPYSYYKVMEQMAENSSNQMYSDPVHFVGKIKKLNKEEYYYFKDYFEDAEWTNEEIEALTLPYYIDCYTNPTGEKTVFCLVFFGGIAFIVAGIYRFVKGKTGGFLKKLREDIQISGYSDSYVESDYAAAQKITQMDDIKMGRLMTYYHSGAEYRAIPHNKIMWAYQITTTHRTNGIKTGTSYSVMYYIDGCKNSTTLGVSNEATALEILRRLDETCPWIVVGFSDEWKKLFNKNRAEFLQLRYNTVEHTPVEPGFQNTYGQPVEPASENASGQAVKPTLENAQSQTGGNNNPTT